MAQLLQTLSCVPKMQTSKFLIMHESSKDKSIVCSLQKSVIQVKHCYLNTKYQNPDYSWKTFCVINNINFQEKMSKMKHSNIQRPFAWRKLFLFEVSSCRTQQLLFGFVEGGQMRDSCWIRLEGRMASSLSRTQPNGRHSQLKIVFAMTPMGSGYWWVRRASRAVKEHRPAVNRMKNGSSFLGYTDTSWNAGKSSLSALSVHVGYGQNRWPFSRGYGIIRNVPSHVQCSRLMAPSTLFQC